MKVIVTDNYDESCKVVAKEIIEVVKSNPNAKLGLATGGTAQNVYPYIVKAYEANEVSFKNVSTVNLDEYVGMPASSPLSYRKSMDEWFFDCVDIDKNNTYVASGTNNIDDEIKIFNQKLYSDKMLDFQLLGVGTNGHIGFNEPADSLIADVHTSDLDQKTIESNARFFDSIDQVPKTSITMGVGDIMKASKIVLIATGDNKVDVIKDLLMNSEVTTKNPVTLLKLHRDCTIVIDNEMAQKINYTK